MGISLLLLLIAGGQAASVPMQRREMMENMVVEMSSGSGSGSGSGLCTSSASCPEGYHCMPAHAMAQGADGQYPGCMLNSDMASPSPSPPPRPPPSAPPPAVIVRTVILAEGEVSDYAEGSVRYNKLKTEIATAAGVSEDMVSLTIVAGSVIITADVTTFGSVAAAAAETGISTTFSSAAASSTLLGFVVTSTPTVYTVSKNDDKNNARKISFIVCFTVGIPLILICAVVVYKYRKAK